MTGGRERRWHRSRRRWTAATTTEVLRLTDALLADRPGDDAAHELRARALLALGRIDEAEQHAADAVRLDPDEIRYRELLAQVLAARGAHRDAAAEYGRLARNDPRQREWLLAEAGSGWTPPRRDGRRRRRGPPCAWIRPTPRRS